jgi:hypothetical protein
VGAIHLAHATFADLGGDFVDAEAGTGSEGQFVGIIRAERRGGTNRSCVTGQWRPILPLPLKPDSGLGPARLRPFAPSQGYSRTRQLLRSLPA